MVPFHLLSGVGTPGNQSKERGNYGYRYAANATADTTDTRARATSTTYPAVTAANPANTYSLLVAAAKQVSETPDRRRRGSPCAIRHRQVEPTSCSIGCEDFAFRGDRDFTVRKRCHDRVGCSNSSDSDPCSNT